MEPLTKQAASGKKNYLEESLQKLLRFPITDRVKRLQPFTIVANVDWYGEIDYERIVTRVYRETEGDPMVLRRAKVFAALCREYPIAIGDDNLLVGYREHAP